MDSLDELIVRFHIDGEFINDGTKLHFCGGREAIAHIDRDKVSLPEVVGHLKDHCSVEDGTLLHWLCPGKDLSNGLRALVDDQACMDMSKFTEEGCVAEVYVEQPIALDQSNDEEGKGVNSEDSDYEAELDLEHNSECEDEEMVDGGDELEADDLDLGSGKLRAISDKVQKEIQFVREFYSPIKGKGKAVMARGNIDPSKERGKAVVVEGENDTDESSSDSEYLPGDIDSSEQDEEAKEIQKSYKQFKKKVKSGEAAQLDDVFVEGPKTQHGDLDMTLDEGHVTPYSNSTDVADESYDDMDSDHGMMKKESKFPRFSPKDPIPKFSLGMKFTGKKQFKKAIIKHGLAEKKVIKFVKDEGDRVRAKCEWPTCAWVCLLSTKSNTTSWQITTLNSAHTCPPRRDNKLVTSRRIAEKYEKLIIANPTWKLESMKDTVQEEMFADVSLSKLKRAKSIVMQKLLDSSKGQYQRLFDYQLELLRSNPGSTVIVKLDTAEVNPIFQRMYICLAACKKGFKVGCRKVVGLDGCFFKGATNGELLCAVGRDGNNQMYPIAWAVVEKENNESWDWFCGILFKDIEVHSGEGWVFISDQQKGILNTVDKWAPSAEHRNCARHIYANWRKKYKKKEWQKKWWRCAKSPCPMLFNLARAKLAQVTRDGAQAVLNSNPSHWSRAWFKLGSNCDSVDNNLCESFNKWIVEARFYPIITMLEMIRRKVMVRIQEMSAKADRWNTQICPNILKKLNTYIAYSGACHAISSGNEKYEVVHYDHRWTVNLKDKTCSCRYWQLSGLPCSHAISCIFFRTNSLDDYIATCFTVAEVKKTYSHYLEPVEGMHNWPISDREKPMAPGYVRMPGRPKKERKRESTEKPKPTKLSRVGTLIRCRICKGIGHNKSSCAKRNGSASSSAPNASVAPATAPCAPNALQKELVVVSNTQESSARVRTGSRKRSSQLSIGTSTSQVILLRF